MNYDSPPGNDGVPSYLGRLTQAPLLSAEEEISLTKAVQAGCQESRRRLVEANMRLVINIARSYHSKAVPLEDLIQEGAIGLMHAVERFDPERGFRFSTYATHWIRQSIGRAIDNKAKTIRLPAHISQTLRKVERARALLLERLGREPSLEQVALEIGSTAHKLKSLISANQDMLSLDMRVGDNENTTLGSLIRDEEHASPEDSIINGELSGELQGILSVLDERERKILALRLRGLSMRSGQEYLDHAEELNISRERMKQIETQAIKKLRQVAQLRRLREYLNN